MKTVSPIIEYQDKIQDLSIDKIEINPYNPRERFNEEEEDELIDSILTKGILNPIIVYKRKLDNRYIILDGERRFRACRKLNIDKIPARILVREPTLLENLSLMFHIHNVRQEWTEFAISLTIKRILEELGKDINHLNRADILDLSKITSLSEYRISKYLKYLDYPDEVFNIFLNQEINQRKREGPDPDILLEMHKPISDMKLIMPDILKSFSVKKMIDACIKKKEEGVIKANKEFRLIAQSLTAAKNNEIDVDTLKRNLVNFFSNIEYSPERVYHETAEDLFHFKHIKKNSEYFLKELKLFDFESLDQQKKQEVLSILAEILIVIKQTL
jgi:ParB/RepB/Spo0J family partition protein